MKGLLCQHEMDRNSLFTMVSEGRYLLAGLIKTRESLRLSQSTVHPWFWKHRLHQSHRTQILLGRMKRISTILCVLCVFVVQAEPLQFNRDIRPILSENCFACHGFDEKERKAKLRLDVSESAFKKSKDGTAPIVPGKPAESLVWQRIITSDPDDIMPPPESHKKLDDKKKAILKQRGRLTKSTGPSSHRRKPKGLALTNSFVQSSC